MSKAPVTDVCVIRMGYRHVLLPAEKGLKVIALLRGAVEVKHSLDRDVDWEIEGDLEVTYESTKASRVRANPDRATPPRSPRAIGHEPLKLPSR